MSSAVFAFLHHVAAFTLVAAVSIEFVLLRDPLTLERARRLRAVDAILGISAGMVLAVGLLRVFYFEKGADYYFHNHAFLAKLALFVIVALLSIYPTVVFLSWGKALKQGQVPMVGAPQARRLRRLIHWELAGIVLLVLCAALMARGIGQQAAG
jgi:putative membrane protein